jgi:hypothetical protein
MRTGEHSSLCMDKNTHRLSTAIHSIRGKVASARSLPLSSQPCSTEAESSKNHLRWIPRAQSNECPLGNLCIDLARTVSSPPPEARVSRGFPSFLRALMKQMIRISGPELSNHNCGEFLGDTQSELSEFRVSECITAKEKASVGGQITCLNSSLQD